MNFSPLWVFLDFDGVIMDSMTLKLDAYCFALAEYGFPRARIRELQLRSAGLSRSHTLPLIYETLSGSPMTPEAQERALHRFSEEDHRLRAKMTLKSGAREFLVAARNRIPLAVITGTPQEVIDETVEVFELGGFFREVCGYPPAKPEHLALQLERRNLRPEQTLYVGDAVMDFEAARSVGIPFVGIDNGDHPFADLPVAAVMQDLGELIPRVELG
jgi:HAD superfamily hydrolase (TIGR01549 family)